MHMGGSYLPPGMDSLRVSSAVSRVVLQRWDAVDTSQDEAGEHLLTAPVFSSYHTILVLTKATMDQKLEHDVGALIGRGLPSGGGSARKMSWR